MTITDQAVIEDLMPDDPFLLAIGKAMQEYAKVETTQASLIERILQTEFLRAHAIFFAVQNTRSRNELIETLLQLEFGSKPIAYWNQCSKFLLTLSVFRNALAHWQPFINMYERPDGTSFYKHALGHAVITKHYAGIEIEDFSAFSKDCKYIREQLSALIAYAKDRPATSPDIFQKPKFRPNLAVLRRLPRTKARQPQQKSSHPKVRSKRLSSAQRRKQAVGLAARKRG